MKTKRIEAQIKDYEMLKEYQTNPKYRGKHTPTPWKALDAEDEDTALIVGANGEEIATCYKLDAPIIVRACNNFEGMLEALRYLIANNETGAMEWAINNAKQAIAKAKEGI